MKAKSGVEAFDHYFGQIYGDRWPAIREGLENKDAKVARANLFLPERPQKFPGVGVTVDELDHCYEVDEHFDLALWEQNLLPYYRMDPASVVAARTLVIEKGDRVLDMCAAPGGKSLVLMEQLTGAFESEDWNLEGELVANEMSAKRRFRMMSVFKRYLPKEVRSRIKIKGWDGSLFGRRQPESFERILLDAPCSGERGVLQKASDLALWKEKRSKNFGVRQYSLLASAFDALKPGGQLVYSTCSMSPHENDEVITKLGKRKKDQFQIEEIATPKGFTATEFGFQALPDQQGWGPIYFCSIYKN